VFREDGKRGMKEKQRKGDKKEPDRALRDELEKGEEKVY